MAAPEGYKALGKVGIRDMREYSSTATYNQMDAVYHNGSTYLALKDAPSGAPNNDGINWRYLAKGFTGDMGDSTVAFTEASSRENINTGESVKTVFGKIKKWFADMTAAAFAQIITSNTDLMATTVAGYLPDALAVKNQFDEVNSKLLSFGSTSINLFSANPYTAPADGYVLIYVNPKTAAESIFVNVTDGYGVPICCTAKDGTPATVTGIVKKGSKLGITATTGLESSSACIYVPIH